MEKRVINLEKQKKSIAFSNSKLKQDEDIQVLRLVFSKLKKKYHLSSADLLNAVQEDILLPCTIFSKKLSPLETDVKYLKENLNYDYSKIAKLLGRDRKTIWQAYKNAVKKMPEEFKPKETEYNIPVSELKDELSILEATVNYLKQHFDINYHQIGELLQRDERTIWTVYHRAQIKKKHE